MKYPCIVRWDSELDLFVAKSLSLHGCIGQGETVNKALDELEINELVWLDGARKDGWQIPIIQEDTVLTINEYQTQALRTTKEDMEKGLLFEEGAMGLCGEAGEVIDILKKAKFQGHEIEVEHVVKELGDIAWYLAVSAYALGYDLETVLRTNIEKLKKRYPDGFEEDKSVHRKSDDI